MAGTESIHYTVALLSPVLNLTDYDKVRSISNHSKKVY